MLAAVILSVYNNVKKALAKFPLFLHSDEIASMKKQPFPEIQQLLRDARFDEAFRLCQQIRSLNRRPPAPLLYLGACALFGMGHIHQAETWVQDHAASGGSAVDNLYLLAYVHLHSRRLDQALVCWTRILQIDPAQIFADTLIEKLKEGEKTIVREIHRPASYLSFVPLEFAEEKNHLPVLSYLKNMMPELPGKKITAAALIGLVVAVVAGLYFSGFFRHDPYRGLTEKLPGPPATGTVIPPEEFKREKPRFYFEDRNAAIRLYNEAREKIGQGQINQARYLLSRIELSNAGFEIKERADLLRDLIPDVDKKDFRDEVKISDIWNDPYMFRGAQVLWEGRISSLQKNEKISRFTLNQDDVSSALIVVETQNDRNSSSLEEGSRILVFGTFLEKQGSRLIVRAREITKP